VTEVHGVCDERFLPLRDVFRSNLASGLDEGASLAVTHDGELVVDLWGGTRDLLRSQLWERDTLVRVFSSSKVMVTVAILALVDRGLLDLDAPIATYWPEFARHGKGGVTARQVLTHRSGVPGFGRSIPFEELGDWDYVVRTIEDAELWFEPGTVTCYSPDAFGFQLGEVVRRVTGLPLQDFFRAEFADPLGLDFHFAIDDPLEQARVADLWPDTDFDGGPPDTASEIAARVMSEDFEGNPWLPRESLSTVAPAGSGIANGRAFARVGAMLAMGGELDGRRYLSRSIIDEASSEQNVAEDLLLGPIRYGLCFGLHSEEFPAATPTSFHWGGYGGSSITMDMASGTSLGFTPNRLRVADSFLPDGRLGRLWRALGEVSRSLS
jgi:CubicO group peptidase (beta-lactamase class C family)